MSEYKPLFYYVVMLKGDDIGWFSSPNRLFTLNMIVT